MAEPNLLRLHHALVKTCNFLDGRQFPYAIVGGLAVAIWWKPRATNDVDIVVAVPAHNPEALRLAIQQESPFLLESEILTFPPHTVVVRGHLLGPESPEPDLILVDLIVLSSELCESILRRRVSLEYAGRAFWFVSKEDLVLMKLLASRSRDLDDIRGILSIQATSIDLDYIKGWVQRLGCEKSWSAVQAD
ncbi:MAG: hypothetical protein K2R98_04905 [Gemmataceae bacterium]|nr:hypothetical protein [Gemmataceae bacterium]